MTNAAESASPRWGDEAYNALTHIYRGQAMPGPPYLRLQDAPELIARLLHPGSEPLEVQPRDEVTALARAATAEAQRAALDHAVSSGQLVTRNSTTGERLTLPMPSAVVMLADLDAHLKRQGIVLDLRFDPIDRFVPWLASQLVEAQADRWRKDRTGRGIWRETAEGYAAQYLFQIIVEKVSDGAPAPVGGRPMKGELYCDVSWGLVRADAVHLLCLIDASLPAELWERINSRAIEAQEQRQREAARAEEKLAAGRYTPQEAARYIAQQTEESASDLLDSLDRAALEHGRFHVYGPGSGIPQDYAQQVRERGSSYVHISFEMYWDELNTWLEKDTRIPFRFPDPVQRTPKVPDYMIGTALMRHLSTMRALAPEHRDVAFGQVLIEAQRQLTLILESDGDESMATRATAWFAWLKHRICELNKSQSSDSVLRAGAFRVELNRIEESLGELPAPARELIDRALAAVAQPVAAPRQLGGASTSGDKLSVGATAIPPRAAQVSERGEQAVPQAVPCTSNSGGSLRRANARPIFRVVLSSTFEDLDEKRREVMLLMGRHDFHEIVMENHAAKPTLSTRVSSLQMVEIADAYVGIIGYRYGTRVAPEDLSLTELEWRRAKDLGIPRCFLVMSDRYPVPQGDLLAVSAVDRESLAKFRKQVQEDVVCAMFEDDSEFIVQAMQSLEQLRRDLDAIHHPSQPVG